MVALIALTVLACLLGSFLTCEVAGRVFFFVWVCGMFLVMCGFFTMVPTFAYRLFGSQHFNANLGLLYTQGIIGSLMSTLLAPVLKNLLGWHGMFYFSFGAVFVGLLLNMSLDIPCGNTIPQHMYRDLALLQR
ncbi:hypothetical protein BaRGS_00037544 [Batillaria attramentaria]|uniref:Monocarboxylate transporter n=1 Tax=Batillaria attramentaria TaxID=370345 RepID=A0ABD0J8D4_9CAEN